MAFKQFQSNWWEDTMYRQLGLHKLKHLLSKVVQLKNNSNPVDLSAYIGDADTQVGFSKKKNSAWKKLF